MALHAKTVERVFRFGALELPDPDPATPADEVKRLYAAQYPELTTAAVKGPELSGGRQIYVFERSVGTKG